VNSDSAREGMKNVASFEVFYLHYKHEIEAWLIQQTCDGYLAEDLTQETFIRLWKTWCTDKHPWYLRPWLYAVAEHRKIAHYSRNKSRERIVLMQSLEDLQEKANLDIEDYVSIEDNCEIREGLNLALRAIKPIDRSILGLNYAGYNHKEIAVILDLPYHITRKRFSRACSKIRRLYIEKSKIIMV